MQATKALVMVLACATSVQPALAAGLEGVWRTEHGESHITIEACPSGYCGKVVYLAEPFDETGLFKADRHNPDPKLRGRPLLGLTIVHGMKAAERPGHWKGQIYNPEDGDTYTATIDLDRDRLVVEGCVAYVICGSQTWTRLR